MTALKRRMSDIEKKERHRYYEEKRKRNEREWKERIEKEVREKIEKEHMERERMKEFLKNEQGRPQKRPSYNYYYKY